MKLSEPVWITTDENQGFASEGHLKVNFDISWTDNTVNIDPEPALWNRFISEEVFEEFYNRLYSDLVMKFRGLPNTEGLRRDVYKFIQDLVEEYQNKGLLR
ncbi:hypothetical protein PP939_gp110 [Rhizobium phage RL38J1]|uniref:Uncharacterized protein n=1 Tax=Rhizobium phage RL38J1 TaxID=2663232 RepID=A0A6B9J198_9CAUD|nr:hypothetical protein PP939_gp110 [Rhizobium phage RL38J1]QGZ13984.1 hypothetical protein RL38J1_110 [Rhizobium phage RL38J1]